MTWLWVLLAFIAGGTFGVVTRAFRLVMLMQTHITLTQLYGHSRTAL